MKQSIIKIIAGVAVVVFAVTASISDAATAGQYTLDKAHTNVGFEVSHMGISIVVGRFNTFQGTVDLGSGGASKVNVEIDVASVDTNSDRRDRHLRSADFFDANRFPKMTYVSKSVKRNATGEPVSIDGTLSFHGHSKPVTLLVSPVGEGKGPLGKERAGFQAEATIRRSEFGMDKLLMAAGDEVRIVINVEIIKK